MEKLKLYVLFGLILFLSLLILTAGCAKYKQYDIVESNDSFYIGETKNGYPHGQGKLRIDGDTYEGEFRNGKPTGNGTWTYAESKPSTTTPSTKTSSASCGHESCAEEGPFYCMGKDDTCNNKTGCAYVFYCSSCR